MLCRIAIVFIWLMLGAYPLLVYPHSQDPEMTWLFPKFFFLLFLSVIALFLLVRTPFKATRENQTPLNHLPRLLLFVIIVAAILSSANQLLSYDDSLQYVLLGGNLRLNGLLYTLGVVTLAASIHKLLTSSGALGTCQHNSPVRHTLRALGLGGLIQSALAISEFLGYSPITRLQGHHLVIGTVGNPGILGILLAISALASLGLYLSSSGRAKSIWASVSTLELFTLGLTANRASMLGLFLALLVWLIIWPSQLKKHGQHKRALDPKNAMSTFQLLFVFSLAIIIVSTGYYTGYASGGKNVANTHSATARFEIWRLALVSLTKIPGEPFIGGGPDAFRLTLATRVPIRKQVEFYLIEYPKYARKTSGMVIKPLWTEDVPIRSRAWMISWGDSRRPVIFRFTLDRAHNLFLDRLLAYGLLGTLAWFALFFGSILPLVGNSEPSSPENYTLAAMLVAVFVYSLFWFLSIQVEPVVTLIAIMAWVAALPASTVTASNTS